MVLPCPWMYSTAMDPLWGGRYGGNWPIILGTIWPTFGGIWLMLGPTAITGLPGPCWIIAAAALGCWSWLTDVVFKLICNGFAVPWALIDGPNIFDCCSIWICLAVSCAGSLFLARFLSLFCSSSSRSDSLDSDSNSSTVLLALSVFLFLFLVRSSYEKKSQYFILDKKR